MALGSDECIADALNNIGILHYVWGDHGEALEYYSRVLEIRRKLGDKKRLAIAHNNLGTVYYAAGRYEVSLDYYAEALPLYEEIGEPRLVASTQNNIGLAHQALGNHEEALRRFERALDIEEGIDDKSGLAQTLNNLGLAYSSLGQDLKSLELNGRSLAVREQIGDRQGVASCRHDIGRIHAKLGDFDLALRYLDDALRMADEIGVKELERDVFRSLSETYERMGNPARALEYHKRYKEADGELLNDQAGRRLANWRARYESEKKDHEIDSLRKEQEFQRIVRNVMLSGSVLLVVLVLLLFSLNRLKTRANLEMRRANDGLEQAQAEREKAARAELTHVSRVALMGELSTALAHELNQPLTAILSNAQAMRRLVANDRVEKHEIDEALSDIACGAGRAREIIQRLRGLMRRSEITQESLDINRVLRDVEKIARADAEHHGVVLEFDLARDLPVVSGDPIQLQQVFLNLVHNSAEAMQEMTADNVLVVETDLHQNRDLRVAIVDSGPGVDDQTVVRMFEPFFTTKKEGLGMGLPICSSIIEAHGGRLWATRNRDRGLTVQFTLPPGTQTPH